MDADDSLRGALLIASPALHDPNFRRTVVLIAEHGDEGAMGVVLNRPSEALAAEAFLRSPRSSSPTGSSSRAAPSSRRP